MKKAKPIASTDAVTIGPFPFTATLWRYSGEKASWYFVTLPVDTAEDIRACTAGERRGWGSIPVIVTIGTSCWSTSLFPHKEGSTFLLPVKADVRKKEGLEEGKALDASVSLTI